MRTLGLIARPMLASVFVAGGLDAVKAPGPRTAMAEKIGLPQPELMVRLNGAAMVLGGAALAVGYKPRRAAFLLAATLAPTTYAGHAFWEVEEPTARHMQQIQFMKNASLMGGLLLAVGDAPHAGTPHSARKAAKHVAKAAVKTARQTEKAELSAGGRADKKASKISDGAQKAANKITAKAEKKAGRLEAKAAKKLAAAAV